jgi:hypothetical protein
VWAGIALAALAGLAIIVGAVLTFASPTAPEAAAITTITVSS